MAAQHDFYNVAPNTANAIVQIATATTVKTLAQVLTPSTQDISVVMWSVSFTGASANTPIACELTITDKAAAVTAFTPQKWTGNASSPVSLCSSGTGYNATNEGVIGSYTVLDNANVPPTSGYTNWFPLGSQPLVPVSNVLRIRATGSASDTPNALVNLVWTE